MLRGLTNFVRSYIRPCTVCSGTLQNFVRSHVGPWLYNLASIYTKQKVKCCFVGLKRRVHCQRTTGYIWRMVPLRGTRQSVSHPLEINRRFSLRRRRPHGENLRVRRGGCWRNSPVPRPLGLVLRTFGYVGRVLAQLRGAPAVGAGFENRRVRMAVPGGCDRIGDPTVIYKGGGLRTGWYPQVVSARAMIGMVPRRGGRLRGRSAHCRRCGFSPRSQISSARFFTQKRVLLLYVRLCI